MAQAAETKGGTGGAGKAAPMDRLWAENEETLGDIVTHVLIHEIGHHFGLSDDDMERIEEAADEVAIPPT